MTFPLQSLIRPAIGPLKRSSVDGRGLRREIESDSLELSLTRQLGLGDDRHVDNVSTPLAVHERLGAGGEGGACISALQMQQ